MPSEMFRLHVYGCCIHEPVTSQLVKELGVHNCYCRGPVLAKRYQLSPFAEAGEHLCRDRRTKWRYGSVKSSAPR
jgi:hypothetical protein